MAKKKEGKHEIEEAAPRKPATTRKRKRGASMRSAAASGMCDDAIVRSIFARLPARTLVASMALSKHHRRMILCPEFRSLHCRLGPPLPRQQIAYIATAKIGRGGYVVSEFHSFHVASAGLGGGGAPTRSLTGASYLGMKYINSCRGVLLLANSCRCVFWNPCCVANNEKKEVAIPGSTRGDCVLGFGYGTRSQTYKLLIARKCQSNSS
ncbi:hypothetical protein C2845_PM02G34000 [Panicum miliaceum]|uniref:F-box domain-containing protein n=1 Tax=Panicum miliaceum TaxID=4540 RepID=A0A3L6S5I2_PANMI|nr:hypothetical protein C2845_PM02G34000 [Panicum miliaceum]